jgi:hypothetical protein
MRRRGAFRNASTVRTVMLQRYAPRHFNGAYRDTPTVRTAMPQRCVPS